MGPISIVMPNYIYEAQICHGIVKEGQLYMSDVSITFKA